MAAQSAALPPPATTTSKGSLKSTGVITTLEQTALVSDAKRSFASHCPQCPASWALAMAGESFPRPAPATAACVRAGEMLYRIVS
jgi:hypothetical protein